MKKELWFDIKMMAWSYLGVLLFAGFMILHSPKMSGLFGQQVYVILEACANPQNSFYLGGMCPIR